MVNSVLIGLEDIFGFKPRTILVFGIGGGGDVVSAATLARWFRYHGIEAYTGSIVWERFTFDPYPGPIPFKILCNAELLYSNVAIVRGDTYAVRNGKRIELQVAKTSHVSGDPVYAVDIWGGYRGYLDGVRKLVDNLGVEAVIAIDVGGDVLATGREDNLWSPLADSLGLAVFSSIDNSVLAVHGVGGDGELEPDYVLKRLSMIASEGGLRGAKGLTRREASLLEKILNVVGSEASRVPLLAYKGVYGEVSMRHGTRKVYITPLQTITFFLDISIAYRLSPLAKAVQGTGSFEEANEALHRLCVYTEYDLEKDLYTSGRNELGTLEIINIRDRGRFRIRKEYCGEN